MSLHKHVHWELLSTSPSPQLCVLAQSSSHSCHNICRIWGRYEDACDMRHDHLDICPKILVLSHSFGDSAIYECVYFIQITCMFEPDLNRIIIVQTEFCTHDTRNFLFNKTIQDNKTINNSIRLSTRLIIQNAGMFSHGQQLQT